MPDVLVIVAIIAVSVAVGLVAYVACRRGRRLSQIDEDIRRRLTR